MEFVKSGPNKRVCAFLIDMVIGNILGIIISFVVRINIGWILSTLYILFKDCIFEGQSLGKKIVKIQIMADEAQSADIGKRVLRNLTMIIPLIPLVEYFVMLRNAEGKRLGDKLAKTKVTDLNPQAKDMTFLWISLAIIIVYVGIMAFLGVMATQAAGTV